MGEHLMLHPLLEEWKKENPDLPRPDYFVSANDLTPEGHAVVQGIAQEYIDSSISKTVNAPNDHTVEDVKRLYSMAYDIGLKGITYMRDGSRPGVLSREDKKEEKKEVHDAGVEPGQTLRPRADKMHGVTYKMATPVGSAFITINDDEAGNPLEVFVSIGKAGSDLTAMAEALGRVASTLLRLNSSISSRARAEEVASQLAGIGGRRSIGFGSNKVYSLPDAVAQALKRHLRESAPVYEKESLQTDGIVVGKLDEQAAGIGLVALNSDSTPVSTDVPLKDFLNVRPPGGDICPECGVAALVYEEGCAKCYACGHSEC
jgi:ribonucleoside-diphosphate reductase alpha chain